MKIKYSPQVNSEHTVSYNFDGDIVTVDVNGQTDSFNFSTMPNDSIVQSINSSLPIRPICSARKDESGVVWLELFKPISASATEAELFPEWETV
tara:strand:- start:706 stop:987 length:282 start_codon:yes stop_codon:yes gene_type:complete